MNYVIIKLRDEKYYLVEGPTGYAFARSKARAKRFAAAEEASAFVKNVMWGDVTMLEIIEESAGGSK